MAELEKLKQNKFFKRLTSEEMLFLAPFIEEKKILKGEVILPQGSEGGDLYLVIAGVVSVDIVLPGSDNVKNFTELSCGQVFGEVTFLSNKLVTASIVAKENCNCLVLSQKILQMLHIARPEIANKIQDEVIEQIASKIDLNINNLLELLKRIPENAKNGAKHADSLENPLAKNYKMEFSELKHKEIVLPMFVPKLTQDQRQRLLSLMTFQRYDKGFRFSIQKDRSEKLAFIYSGAVMFFIKENKKLKKAMAVLGVGEIFIPNFFSEEFTQHTDYISCEQAILLELDLGVYKNLHQSDPELFYAVSEEFNKNFANSVYVMNRQFVRINSEYNDLIL